MGWNQKSSIRAERGSNTSRHLAEGLLCSPWRAISAEARARGRTPAQAVQTLSIALMFAAKLIGNGTESTAASRKTRRRWHTNASPIQSCTASCEDCRTRKNGVCSTLTAHPHAMDGIQADMAVLEMEDVRQQAKYKHATQRAAFWSACLEQTIMYDPRTEMSLALTAVLPNDKYFAMPFIVSRRARNQTAPVV